MADNQLYAGFDRLEYPGDHAMQWLWDNTNLWWCGFYLAPAPSQQYTGWMDRYAKLKEIGWGIAPIFTGQQTEESSPQSSHELDELHGEQDARQAAELATQAGFQEGSVVYLDIEGGPVEPDLSTYYQAWVARMISDGRYYPGIYCSYQIAPQLRNLDTRPRWWVYHVTHGCDPDYPSTYNFFPNELEPRMEFPTTTAPNTEPGTEISLDPRDSFAYARMLQWCQSIGNPPPNKVPCKLVVDGEEKTEWDFDTATLKDPSDQALSF